MAGTSQTEKPKQSAVEKSKSRPVVTAIPSVLDENMRTVLSDALKNHAELLADRQRVSGLLKDLFPERRREVNILLQIYDLGIVDELQRQREINQLFIQRFTGRIVNEYGTAEQLAEKMVLLWCYCYGHDCCKIPWTQ